MPRCLGFCARRPESRPGEGRDSGAWDQAPPAGRGLLDQVGYDLRLRDMDGVAGGDLADRGAGPVGRGPLGGRPDHPVFGGHEVPAGLGPPGRLADLAAQGVDPARDLRVGQELGVGRREVAGEGAVEFRPALG